jgi:predicted DNA-binding transcriptional regulator YafY
LSRAQRLLNLIQLLRQHRYAVSGQHLADTLGVSLRTIYRDIATLQEQGATIEGEPGLGYLLRPGFLMPPLMFSAEELEALILGSRWVIKKTDSHLMQAAHSAVAKIEAVLPKDLRNQFIDSGLLIGPGQTILSDDKTLISIRQAIRKELKTDIFYLDANEKLTGRRVWPFAIGFFEQVQVVVAWCELREEFRHFRIDRMKELTLSNERYPKRRQVLLKAWRDENNIPAQ